MRIAILILVLLNSISAKCQAVKLKHYYKEVPLEFNNNHHELNLFFISGFDDTTTILLNGKVVFRNYIQSASKSYDNYFSLPLKVKSDKINRLEISVNSSDARYYTEIVKGYGVVMLYLDRTPTVTFTNRLPSHQ